MKLDILVFAAHPDDAELTCSGTIAKHIDLGYKVGVIDLTQGELGTRGTPELRMEEAAKSSSVLGLAVRENLKMKDGFFQNDIAHQLQLVEKIRKYKPEIVLGNAIQDRHPDHGRAAALIKEAFFLSGLPKIETMSDGQLQQAYRPRHLYHYIQSNYIQPDFIVDVSDYWEPKIDSIKAFKSQFYDPDSEEPATFISSEGFLDFIEARCLELGHRIGAKYGEGFTKVRDIGVDDLFKIR